MKLSLISTHDKASDIAHINVFCNLHLELQEKVYFSWRFLKLKIFFPPSKVIVKKIYSRLLR